MASDGEIEDFSGAFVDCAIGEFDTGEFIVAEAKRQQFFARLTTWREDRARIAIYFQTEGEIERFREIMAEARISLGEIDLFEGTLARGFCFPSANLVVLAAAELFGRAPTHGRRRLQRAAKFGGHRTQIDFSELNEGELVVHLEHGIGRFLGLQRMGGPETSEVLAIEFAEEAKLYVPLEQAFMVSRYVGVGKKSPSLSSLADAKWTRAKKNAAASIFDYAGKMLALQAERETQRGHAFGPDTRWQLEFEHSFPFRETPDQLKTIAETKRDMEEPRSMDRLICGDVGFGKTEVAIRAAFKAVMDGKQVAVLTPTTVLAQQHFETFRQRMLDYPVRIEMLSRFRSHAEQRKVLEQLREGGVDVVVGTHRLISGDVVFKNLGLVVIDEEQRFGVLHKEKFKELFKLVDVLTLSATPIPRTLYLSLVGVKDMSTIETPPLNRLPVETVICGYDERIIRDAINRELERQGQVYFLHNRVMSIQKVRDRIAELCPGARVEFGHGQMDADELEDVMQRFVAGKIDVLVCTTIIESGLDIPNANTIIIDRADRFGLGGSLSAAGPRRSRRTQSLCLPPSPARDDDGRRGAQADQRHPAIQFVRGGFPHRNARPGDSRRGQHPRHRAKRSHCRGRVRPLLPAVEAGRRATERRKAPAPARGGGAARFRRHERRRIPCRRPRKARARVHSHSLHQRRRAPDSGLPEPGRNHDQRTAPASPA